MRAPARILLGAAALGAAATALMAGAAHPRPLGADEAREVAPALTGTVLNASAALALPTRIAVAGDLLVVIDAAADSVLHVLDRHTGRLVRSLGRRGRGPGEFEGAWWLARDPRARDAVWVYDLALRRLTRVTLGGDRDTRASQRPMVRLADGAVLTGPAWLAPDTIVSAGFLSDARVAVFNASGHRIGALGVAPYPPHSRQPMQAQQAILAVRPDGRRAAIFNRYVSRVELFDLREGTARTFEGPVGVNAGRASVDLERFAYLDAAATAAGVVALFSGRSRAEYDGRAVFGDALHLFDWDGRFAGEVRLDGDVLAIAVSERDGTVYAVRHDPVPAVVAYRR